MLGIGCLSSIAQTSSPPSTIVQSYTGVLRLNPTNQNISLEDVAWQAWIGHSQKAIHVAFYEEDPAYADLENFHKLSQRNIKQSPIPEQWKQLLTAELNLQLAFVRFKMGKELQGAWLLRSTYKQLERLHREYPDFLPAYKSLGLLEVVLSLTPQQYQWLLNILGIKAETAQGLQLLQAAKKDPLFGEEAALWVALLQALVLDDINQALYTTEGMATHPMRDYMLMELLMKAGQAERALTLVPSIQLEAMPPQFHYQLGMAHLQKGQYSQANKAFLAFLAACDCRHLVKSTYFRLHQSYSLQGDWNQAAAYKQLAMQKGLTQSEADKNAARELLEKRHPTLVKARLASDGGFLQEAEEMLQVGKEGIFEFPKGEEEWWYRYGRIKDLQGDKGSALNAYAQCLRFATDDGDYIYANAALKAAEILAAQGKKEEAKQHFEKAISFKKHPYASSIESKAKYGLSNLNK
jgi:tetratricopeptide (TPR) repeat protein